MVETFACKTGTWSPCTQSRPGESPSPSSSPPCQLPPGPSPTRASRVQTPSAPAPSPASSSPSHVPRTPSRPLPAGFARLPATSSPPCDWPKADEWLASHWSTVGGLATGRRRRSDDPMPLIWISSGIRTATTVSWRKKQCLVAKGGVEVPCDHLLPLKRRKCGRELR